MSRYSRTLPPPAGGELPGLGGQCIPVDPRYLAWKMRSMDFAPRFIDLATEVISGMPGWVVDRVAQALNRERKAVNGSRVLVLGVAYKADIADLRESPALDILSHLRERGAEVEYHDPLVPRVELEGQVLLSRELTPERVRSADLVLITTAHSAVDYAMVVREAARVLDTRNAVPAPRPAHVERL